MRPSALSTERARPVESHKRGVSMLGYQLTRFSSDLYKVPVHRNKEPATAAETMKILGPSIQRWAADEELDDGMAIRQLSAKILSDRLSFDQFCKFQYGQYIMMHSTVDELFKQAPEFALVDKIKHSMWRWGCGDGVWNELVDAYIGIRTFEIPIAGFEVRLDFTTGHNERGYSRESRIFLDGVFGFLVYYRGEHVMTLGFSVMKGRQLLVQQVQLVKQKGNRFLYLLPSDRMQFALDCFARSFPCHTLCVIDGRDLGQVSLDSYQLAIDLAKDRLSQRSDKRDREEMKVLQEKLAHLRADIPRLEAFYRDNGAYARGKEFKVNGIRHYRLGRPASMKKALVSARPNIVARQGTVLSRQDQDRGRMHSGPLTCAGQAAGA